MIMRKTVVRDDYPLVQTTSGKVRGMEIDGVLTFRGLPYAQAERFGAPMPVKPWDEIRDCYVWGDTCPVQSVPLTTLFSNHRYWIESEDCLNLNIWTSELNPEKKKPVMFWIHGGGFFSGSSIDEAITEGDGLARTGEVVVVSVNHRLNCLGYLDLRDYGEAFAHSANAGLEDLVAALRWVQDNIAGFGGDPENVTIFGQSGGGAKIMNLMQMPSADGLYHKAIIQSGVSTVQDIHRKTREHGRRTVKQLGLDESNIEKIRTIPYRELCLAADEAAKEMGSLLMSISGSRPDGVNVLDDYVTSGFRAETKHVPVMVGSCAAEGSLFTPRGLKKPEFSTEDKKNMTYEQKVERLRAKFGDGAPQVAELMQKTYPQMDILHALYLECSRASHLDYAAARAAFADAPVFNYEFTYVIPALEGKVAWHGADLGFTFGNLDKSEVLCSDPEAFPLMEKMRDAWIAFAKNGDPNTDALPEWKPFTGEEQNAMIFDTTCKAAAAHDKELLEVMSKYRVPFRREF